MVFSTRLLTCGLAAFAILGACAHTAPAEPAAVTVLASYPNGAFLENLTEAPDGSTIVTSYFARSLERLSGGALQKPFAALGDHPVGIVAIPGGYVVSAHGTPFTDAPAFLATNKILVLDAGGAVTKSVAAPEARFLNGLVVLSARRVLVADSVRGAIWSFDPTTGALAIWLEDPALAVDPAVQPFRPAANGLKLHGGMLYVSNSSRGAIYRIALTTDGRPASAPQLLTQPGPVDDFAIDRDGTIYAATHGETLLKITPAGASSLVMEHGCDGCTSVAITGTGRDRGLLVLTTGRLLEGGKEPAQILRVPLP